MTDGQKLCADLERVLREALRAQLESANLYVVRHPGHTQLRVEGSMGSSFAGVYLEQNAAVALASDANPGALQRIVRDIIAGLGGSPH